MIDLHVHSTASDGTFSPAQIAEAGKDFFCLALTDHDNTDGCRPFLEACARQGGGGIRLPGVELSVDPGAGYGTFHLLGLGIDPDAPCLPGFLERIRVGRAERNIRILERLAALGIPLSEEEVRQQAGGGLVARPHIARALVARGLAKDMKDAFSRYIGHGGPAYAARYRPSQEEAIAAVHAAHGAAIMAHPRFWSDDRTALREGFARLKGMGLDGVEAVYQANEPMETPMHLRLAREQGFAVTAGSDFHGQNKAVVSLGMHVENEAAFLAPLMEALALHGSNFVK